MKRYIMNDYELIYLIHGEQDEVALEFIFKKYYRFIWKIVHLFNVEEKEREDLHQEGQCILLTAINTFDEKRGKTFTRYFELILRRHLYKQVKKIPNYILFDNTDFCKGVVFIEEEFLEPYGLSNFESKIFDLYFNNRNDVKTISNILETTNKQVYNAIYRIRDKLK